MNREEKIDQIRQIVDNYCWVFSRILQGQKHRDLYDFIMEETKDHPELLFKTRVFWIINGIHEHGKCVVCGKQLKQKNCTKNGYTVKTCSCSCAQKNPETREKIRKTNLEKYGVPNACQNTELRKLISDKYKSHSPERKLEINEKRKQTCLKKYGTEYVTQNEEISHRQSIGLRKRSKEQWNETTRLRKKTKLEKYGDENYYNIEKAKQTNLERHGVEWAMQNPEFVKHAHQTNLKKYGAEYYFQTEEGKAKIRKTNLKKYGVESPFKSEKIKEKLIQNCMKKYGVKWTSQIPGSRDKFKETCMKRYGGPTPMSNHDIRKKARSKYLYQNIYFDSSQELAYFIWLSDNGYVFEYHPKVTFTYIENDKERVYFPDFHVDGIGYVEIKANYWWNIISEEKRNCIIQNASKIILSEEYKKYLKYVEEKYGKTFISSLKQNKKTN